MAGPRALGETFDIADDDVGPESAAIVSEPGDCAIGGDEQGEHIEPVGGLVADESRPLANDAHDTLTRLTVCP